MLSDQCDHTTQGGHHNKKIKKDVEVIFQYKFIYHLFLSSFMLH